ncbi:MAG: UDP-N-acetylmuramoyl-L-alanyl-D-glutamate--2,6-diaminopimelate ligase [Clostridiales Family XIII bacterium]|jgi:UDP-N-acetylmuramoyl-L-alanyl-D-glutamate--2,6-diaminopimelate ligase|nr:UDP-N-acetylmuramoyl-L-alanyl-D-glutamate--2,6-diaminopimelate ligase [Clostridiales Family XIII bacterium]
MKIGELLRGIPYRVLLGDADVEISGVAIDSRLVAPGDLFIATVGREADGHDFVRAAMGRGAAAALVMDGRDFGYPEGSGDSGGHGGIGTGADTDAGAPPFCVASVADTRGVLSLIVNRFHGEPSRGFTLIGVTGTNGKTSVATLIDHILQKAGRKTGLLGTIGHYCAGEEMDVRRTTPTNPDCVELGEIMGRMAEAGIDDLVMEVTSMGLKMGRVKGCDFDVAVFTNISPEHLDDHGTMDDYADAKLMLFDLAKSAVVNADDPRAKDFMRRARGAVVSYGIRNRDGCDLYADGVRYSAGGVGFDIVRAGASATGEGDRVSVELSTPAEFAVYNALAAAGACLCVGIALDAAAAALSENIEIAGRYEVVMSGDGVSVVVDYAHTARALENLLEAVRSNPAYGRVISVFGCGGDRDPGKRAVMGEASGRLADHTILTSDNPRTEDPLAIIAQIEEGARLSGGVYETEPDRAKAIEKAILAAAPGDVVVVAGKGHEDYQIIGKEKIHLDDREIARDAIAKREAACRRSGAGSPV